MKVDPKHIMFAFGLVMVTLGLAACAGFDLGDVVKVKTPNEIQQTRGLPSRPRSTRPRTEYRAWFDDVQRTGAQWK
ncbi:MAG: hypothetical protein HC915_21740, partial [Anaerolineae bacterium]|nr:hypothetical protein [Anaerolineae bacterium]